MNPDKPDNKDELSAEILNLLDGLPPQNEDVSNLADPNISRRVVDVIRTPDQTAPTKQNCEREAQKPLNYTERKILEAVEALRELHQKLSGNENALLRETIGKWMFELSGSKDRTTAQKIDSEISRMLKELYSELEELRGKFCIRKSTKKRRDERISFLERSIPEIQVYFEYVRRVFSRIFSQRRKKSTRVQTQVADVEKYLRERDGL